MTLPSELKIYTENPLQMIPFVIKDENNEPLYEGLAEETRKPNGYSILIDWKEVGWVKEKEQISKCIKKWYKNHVFHS